MNLKLYVIYVKKKNESYNSKFYICGTCNIFCCPLCSSIHTKEHKLIDYENFIIYA